MTIQESLKLSNKLLQKNNIINSHLDAELLLAFSLNKSREYILSHNTDELSAQAKKTYNKLIKQRAKQIPLAYLTGTKEFYGFNFLVNKNVLIPRPETELIIDQVQQTIKEINKQTENNKISIIDLGTGSGCIINTLANILNNYKKENTQKNNQIKYLALDISTKALRVAKKNADLHNNQNITFLKSNLLKKIFKNKNILKDISHLLITANLPYLDYEWKQLLKNPESASLKYEPKLALAAGKDGLKYYRKLEEQLAEILKEYPNLKIHIYCEINDEQKLSMEKIFRKYKTETIKDLANKNRLTIVSN